MHKHINTLRVLTRENAEQKFICSQIFIHFLTHTLDFCIGKTDGLHADPEDCRAYYDCVKNRARHRTGLSTGIMFDPQTKTFGRSEDVNCTVQKGKAHGWLSSNGHDGITVYTYAVKGHGAKTKQQTIYYYFHF